MLGLMGGTLGLVLAYAATKALVAANPADIPRLERDRAGLDRRPVYVGDHPPRQPRVRRIAGAAGDGAFTPGLRKVVAVAPQTGTRNACVRPCRHRSRSRRGAPRRRRPAASQLGRADPRGPRIRRRAGACRSVSRCSVAATTQNAVRARVAEFETALQSLPGITARCRNLRAPPERTRSAAGLQRDRRATAAGVSIPRSASRASLPIICKTIGATLVTGRDFTNYDQRQRAAGRDHQRGSGSPLVP